MLARIIRTDPGRHRRVGALRAALCALWPSIAAHRVLPWRLPSLGCRCYTPPFLNLQFPRPRPMPAVAMPEPIEDHHGQYRTSTQTRPSGRQSQFPQFRAALEAAHGHQGRPQGDRVGVTRKRPPKCSRHRRRRWTSSRTRRSCIRTRPLATRAVCRRGQATVDGCLISRERDATGRRTARHRAPNGQDTARMRIGNA